MANDAAVFLGCAGHEAGYVYKGHDRDIERVAEAHETSALHGRIDIQAARQNHGLIGHHTDRAALHAHEAHHDVAGKVRLDLEKITLIGHLLDQLTNVVGFAGIFGHQGIQGWILAGSGVFGGPAGRALPIVGGQVVDETAQHQ